MKNNKDHSSHLTTEQLLDYLEQRLSAVDASFVENHIATDCTSCQEELSWLTQTLNLMGTEPWIDPPPHLQRSARQLYREHRSGSDKESFSLGAWLQSLWPQPRPLAFGLAAAMALIIVAALVFNFWPGQSTANEAEVAAVQGSVVVQEAGSDSWEAVEDSTSFSSGDQIRTGDESSVVLSFPDDSQMIVAPDSEVSILQVSSRPDGSQQVVVLHQEMGTTHNVVQPLPSQDSRFEIQTPSATVTVRGTEFTVEVDSDGTTKVEVDEGTVEVEAQGVTIALTAGESTTVIPGDQPASVEATPSQTATTEGTTIPDDGEIPPTEEGTGNNLKPPATSTSGPLPATDTPRPSPTPETPAATATNTATPDKNPSKTPTSTSTITPTPRPTDSPTEQPTLPPTEEPTLPPTEEPTPPPPPPPSPTLPPPPPSPTPPPPPPPSPTPPPPPPPTDPPPPPSPTPLNSDSGDSDEGGSFVPPGLTKTPQPPGQTKTPQPPGQTRRAND